MKRLIGAAALLLAGCIGEGSSVNTVTLDFDFHIIGENWTPSVAEITTAEIPDIDLTAELVTLPAPLETNRNALHISATNSVGNVFIFFQKRITGLPVNTTFDVQVAIEHASAIHAGCTTGIGPASFIKAGIANIEPEAVADNLGILRMNLNKGTGSAAGEHVMSSDIRNEITGCPTPGTFGRKGGIYKNHSLKLTTDDFGGFWLWWGIESTAIGVLDVYATGMSLRLVPVSE